MVSKILYIKTICAGCKLARKTRCSWCAIILPLALILSVWLSLGYSPSVQAQQPAKNILILHSYDFGLPANEKITAGLLSSLYAGGIDHSQISVEFMDVARGRPSAYKAEMASVLGMKYAHRRIDLIITTYLPAFKFLLEEGKDIFPGIPTLAMLGSDSIEGLELNRPTTILSSGMDMAGTLEIALGLLPQTKKVLAIHGVSETDLCYEQRARTAFKNFEGRLEFEYLGNLPVEEMLRVVANQPPNTVIIFLNMVMDVTGKTLTPRDVAARIAKDANAPVFGLFDTLMDFGVVGGSMLCFQNEGAYAGEFALKILSGELPPSPRQILTTPKKPMFDWNQMNRWGLLESRLPPDSTVINRPESVWVKYRLALLGALGVFLTMFLAIALLTFNIGKRRRAEEALRASEEQLRSYLDGAGDAIFVLEMATGRILNCNASACSTLGYCREELLRMSANDMESQLSPEAMSVINQEAEKKGMLTVEGRHRRKDGSTFPVEIRLSAIALSEPSMLVAIVRDITERKRAEDELMEKERRYRILFEAANDGIFLLSPTGFVDCNKKGADMYGLRQDEVIGRSPVELSPDKQPDGRLSSEVAAQIIEAALAGEAQCFEWQSLRADGVPLDVEITLNRVEVGGSVLLQAIVRDITDRKLVEEERRKLEERLTRAEKMEALGTLAGGVAHDLNNVLGIVVGYSELLVDGLGESSSTRSKAMEILKGGKRAAAIVQDLLTIARRGVSSPIRKVLNLNNIVRECLDSTEFAKLASYNPNLKVGTDFEPDLMNITGSPVHLQNSLINLLSNAVEAMPSGGTITMTTSNCYLDRPISGFDEVRRGDYVVLCVSDTGEGIAASDLKHIFEPFYTKKVMGRSGTGLGLAVVWGTVKDHTGYINVESEQGKGTTFTLYFPVTREELPPEQVSISASEYMGNGESILVVDDVKEQRELAGEMLKKLNYVVESVSSGKEAVEYIQGHSVNLVVLDMIMDPGMDGLDTYRKMLEFNPHQKAIIVSGFSESERVTEAQKLGAGTYVKKPYVLEKLGLAVRKELDQQSKI